MNSVQHRSSSPYTASIEYHCNLQSMQSKILKETITLLTPFSENQLARLEAQWQAGVVAVTSMQRTTHVLYNNYTGNSTTFSQPGVLTVWIHVKNFIYWFVTMQTFRYNNSSSCCTSRSLKNLVEKYFGFKKVWVKNISRLMLTIF